MKCGVTDEMIYLAREAIKRIVRRGDPSLAIEPRRRLET